MFGVSGDLMGLGRIQSQAISFWVGDIYRRRNCSSDGKLGHQVATSFHVIPVWTETCTKSTATVPEVTVMELGLGGRCTVIYSFRENVDSPPKGPRETMIAEQPPISL